MSTKIQEQLEAFVKAKMSRLIYEGFAKQASAPQGDGYNYVGTQSSTFGTASLDGRFDFDAVAAHVMEGLRLAPAQEVFPDAVHGSERPARTS
jgi:hypothetical protein